MANLYLNLYITPLLFATPKLNSDEEKLVSCFQDKAELYVVSVLSAVSFYWLSFLEVSHRNIEN